MNKKILYSFLFLVFLGFIFTGLSAFDYNCAGDCIKVHKYQYFGMPVWILGIVNFSLIGILSVMSIYKNNIWYNRLLQIQIISALGGEMGFVFVQKYVIGAWCTYCLFVGFIVFAMFLLLVVYWSFFIIEIKKEVSSMDIFGRFIIVSVVTSLLTLSGFFITVSGIRAQTSKNEAVNPYLGNEKKHIEVIFVTDWYCPSCIEVDPLIEKISPEIMKKAKITFMELTIHDESINFVPANLSFLVNNKERYFELRKELHKLAEINKMPTEDDFRKIASNLKVNYKPLPLITVNRGLAFANAIVKNSGVTKTPSVVVINRKNNKMLSLEGSNKINEKNILMIIDAISKK